MSIHSTCSTETLVWQGRVCRYVKLIYPPNFLSEIRYRGNNILSLLSWPTRKIDDHIHTWLTPAVCWNWWPHCPPVHTEKVPNTQRKVAHRIRIVKRNLSHLSVWWEGVHTTTCVGMMSLSSLYYLVMHVCFSSFSSVQQTDNYTHAHKIYWTARPINMANTYRRHLFHRLKVNVTFMLSLFYYSVDLADVQPRLWSKWLLLHQPGQKDTQHVTKGPGQTNY